MSQSGGPHLDALKAWAEARGLAVQASSGNQREPENVVAVVDKGRTQPLLSRAMGEADAILEEIEFDQLVSERDRYREALEYLANRPYDEGYREVARSALSMAGEALMSRSAMSQRARDLPFTPPPGWDFDLWIAFRSGAIYEQEVPRDCDGEPLLDQDGNPTRRYA